jgi:hypothetical protein
VTPAPAPPPEPTTRRSLRRLEEAERKLAEALRRLAEADEETQRKVCGDAAGAELAT